MSKYLFYIGERQEFPFDITVEAIKEIDGTSECRIGDFIGAHFDCLYKKFGDGHSLVRISKSGETITLDGSIENGIYFGFALQKKLEDELKITDMGLELELSFRNFRSPEEMLKKM